MIAQHYTVLYWLMVQHWPPTMASQRHCSDRVQLGVALVTAVRTRFRTRCLCQLKHLFRCLRQCQPNLQCLHQCQIPHLHQPRLLHCSLSRVQILRRRLSFQKVVTTSRVHCVAKSARLTTASRMPHARPSVSQRPKVVRESSGGLAQRTCVGVQQSMANPHPHWPQASVETVGIFPARSVRCTPDSCQRHPAQVPWLTAARE